EGTPWPGPDDTWQPAGSELSAPPAAVADALGLPRETAVHVVRRSRVSHGHPVAAELLYVPETSVPGLTADTLPGAAHARAVLRELQQLDLTARNRSVELGSARADDAKQLDRLPGAPVLVVTTHFTTPARIAALSVATYRADTCRLTFGESGRVEITEGAA
ncbi:UTRA domain-containing protein, partial [Streptomyces sp. S6]